MARRKRTRRGEAYLYAAYEYASANTTRNENNSSDVIHANPTTMIVTKKRKVVPFAIPSRGDTCVGDSEASLIRVAEVTTQPAIQQEDTFMPSFSTASTVLSMATVSTTEPSPKRRQVLMSIQREGGMPLSESTTVPATRKPWTPEEDALLKQYYEQGLKYSEISKKIPRRSAGSCANRVQKLGFGGDGHTSKWTQEEDALLKQYYEQGLKYSEISKKIPRRSAGSCANRVQKLGFGGDGHTRTYKWTQEEDGLLKQYYDQGLKISEISKLLSRRSESACSRRLYDIGAAVRSRASSKWTQEKDSLLKRSYEQGLSYAEIAKLLTPHSAAACKIRASKLGYCGGRPRSTGVPWTKEENSLLKQYYENGFKYSEISELLPSRSVPSCQSRVKKLVDHRGDRAVLWTKVEDSILIQHNDQGLKCDDIAKFLGHRRSAEACAGRLYFLSVTGRLSNFQNSQRGIHHSF